MQCKAVQRNVMQCHVMSCNVSCHVTSQKDTSKRRRSFPSTIFAISSPHSAPPVARGVPAAAARSRIAGERGVRGEAPEAGSSSSRSI